MMKFRLIAALLVIMIQMITAAPQKVISYNIRYDSGGDKGVRDWRERAPQIIKFLKESRASVIGLPGSA